MISVHSLLYLTKEIVPKKVMLRLNVIKINDPLNSPQLVIFNVSALIFGLAVKQVPLKTYAVFITDMWPKL